MLRPSDPRKFKSLKNVPEHVRKNHTLDAKLHYVVEKVIERLMVGDELYNFNGEIMKKAKKDYRSFQ